MQAVCAFTARGINNNNKNARAIRSVPTVVIRDMCLRMRDRSGYSWFARFRTVEETLDDLARRSLASRVERRWRRGWRDVVQDGKVT